MIKLINYDDTIYMIDYLALRAKLVSEELELFRDKKANYTKLLNLKIKHKEELINWTHKLIDRDSKLMRYYHIDGLKLKEIAPLINMETQGAARLHSMALKEIKYQLLFNLRTHLHYPKYCEYLDYKRGFEEKERIEKQREYDRKYRQNNQIKYK